MKKRTGRNATSYWLTLAACYGVTLGIATMTPMPWLLVVGAVFVIFPLTVGFLYGQIGSKAQYKLTPDSPAIVITATACGIAAVFLRGSSIVAWAGPLLGLATFVGTYLCLRRYGGFHEPAQTSSPEQVRENTRW